MYSWGDNEYGQQGSGNTEPVRKPQLISFAKADTSVNNRVLKIACGSSHTLVFVTSVPSAIEEFSPITFPTERDPLGTNLMTSKAKEEIIESAVPSLSVTPASLLVTPEKTERPLLTKVVLSLPIHKKKQKALGHILTALQIAYARDAIVNSLGGVVEDSSSISYNTEMELHEQSIFEATGVIPSVSIDTFPVMSSPSSQQPHDTTIPTSHHGGLDEFTSLLSEEDARVIVDLLKLAVAGRAGEKGKETLSKVLTALAQANSTVS